MAEEPKPKRVIRPDDPDLTDLERALGYAIGAVEVYLKAQKTLLKVICEMPDGPEKTAQTKQFREIFKENRALPRWPAREIVGFTAYLQPLATLLLVASVVTVGGSIARDAQNREMCARYMALDGNRRENPARKAAMKKLFDRISQSPGSISARDFCAVYS